MADATETGSALYPDINEVAKKALTKPSAEQELPEVVSGNFSGLTRSSANPMKGSIPQASLNEMEAKFPPKLRTDIAKLSDVTSAVEALSPEDQQKVLDYIAQMRGE